MKDKEKVAEVIKRLKKEYPILKTALFFKSPFELLVATILSAQSTDVLVNKVTGTLFKKYKTIKDYAYAPLSSLQKDVNSINFYKTKAKNIKLLCNELIETYGGEVPDDLEELLKLPGVGRKTANLVLTLGFGKQGICVDTHVHRISNRLGYVKTKSPEETEIALRQKLPEEYWIEFNDLLVTYGQNVCRPISPFCSTCKIRVYCRQVGVKRNR